MGTNKSIQNVFAIGRKVLTLAVPQITKEKSLSCQSKFMDMK
jgi:hypothetical protein